MSSPSRIPAEPLEEAQAIADVGCWLWHPESSHLQISANFHKLPGFAPGRQPEALQACLNLADTDDRPQLGILFKRLVAPAAHGQPGFSRRIRHPNGHEFLTKPIDPDRLQQTLIR